MEIPPNEFTPLFPLSTEQRQRLQRWESLKNSKKKQLCSILCSNVWAHKMNQGNRSQMESLNRRAASTICSIFPGTATKGLEVILNLKPLHIRVEENALAIRARLLNKAAWDGTDKKGVQKSHLILLNNRLEDMGIFHRDCEVTRNMPKLDIKWVPMSKEDIKEKEDTIYVYTDGSKKKEGTGAGVCIRGLMQKEIREPIEREGSALQAEMIAIIEAGEYLIQENVTGKSIQLRTDSSVCLRSMDYCKTKSFYTRRAIDIWTEISQKNEVTMRWIKGHNGIKGNVHADCLAKEATKVEGPQSRIYMSNKTMTSIIKMKGTETWESQWGEEKELRQPREWFPNIDAIKSNEMLRQSKPTLSRMVQFISGFNNMRNHTGRMARPKTTVACRLCGTDEETGIHLAWKCKETAQIRLPKKWEVKELSEFINQDKIRYLLDNRSK